MSVVIEFLKSHIEFVVIVVVDLIAFIILLCKKKVKISDSTLSIYLKQLPSMINAAESQYGAGHGVEKFTFVYQASLAFLTKLLDVDEVTINSKYGEVISVCIENILSTPTKK